jgi:hypothetical protein
MITDIRLNSTVNNGTQYYPCQHTDTEHYETKYNNAQNESKKCTIQYNLHCYADCRNLNIS